MMRKIFMIIHDADFVFMEGNGGSCTIHGRDFAFKEEKRGFCTI